LSLPLADRRYRFDVERMPLNTYAGVNIRVKP
jgi:hypothetical protein